MKKQSVYDYLMENNENFRLRSSANKLEKITKTLNSCGELVMVIEDYAIFEDSFIYFGYNDYLFTGRAEKLNPPILTLLKSIIGKWDEWIVDSYPETNQWIRHKNGVHIRSKSTYEMSVSYGNIKLDLSPKECYLIDAAFYEQTVLMKKEIERQNKLSEDAKRSELDKILVAVL